MRSHLDPGDRDFLEQMHRLGSGTVQEICAHLGVTATAVRQRLGRLQDRGLVARETVRAGRGRPHHAYQVTSAGRRELGENYTDLARILWNELNRIPDVAVRRRVLEGVRESLVRNYGAEVRGATLGERMRELCGALADRGYDVELVTHTGEGPETLSSESLPILRENNCPYLELASSDPSICELEQEVFRQILGTTVTLTQCCLSGSHCCEFEATVTTPGQGDIAVTSPRHPTHEVASLASATG
ncbi:MAG: MarR family transcriptional regulator [Planctomycetaceae bacterium]|nr:MarR family transcriptional regulator [Planctomycetaceae bacterium]